MKTKLELQRYLYQIKQHYPELDTFMQCLIDDLELMSTEAYVNLKENTVNALDLLQLIAYCCIELNAEYSQSFIDDVFEQLTSKYDFMYRRAFL